MLIDGLAGLGIGSRTVALRRQQLSGQSDIVGTVAVGEQAVMPDMVESFWEDVDEEAPDEFMDRQVHGFVAISAFGSIVLPLEGDGLIVGTDKSSIADSNPVGIAGEVSEHRLGSGKRFLSINRPFGFEEGLEIGVEDGLVGESLVVVEELETAVSMGFFEPLEKQASEQTRENAHRQEEVGSARNPS